MQQVDPTNRRNENPARHARILVIEDDDSIIQLMQDFLSPDYQVSTAKDGQAGLELLRCENFDLLILDLGLPGLHGLDMIQRIRTEGPARGIPILVLSAYPDLPRQLEGVDINAFMPKPFSLDKLERQVAQLIRLRTESTRAPRMTQMVLSLQRN